MYDVYFEITEAFDVEFCFTYNRYDVRIERKRIISAKKKKGLLENYFDTLQIN